MERRCVGGGDDMLRYSSITSSYPRQVCGGTRWAKGTRAGQRWAPGGGAAASCCAVLCCAVSCCAVLQTMLPAMMRCAPLRCAVLHCTAWLQSKQKRTSAGEKSGEDKPRLER